MRRIAIVAVVIAAAALVAEARPWGPPPPAWGPRPRYYGHHHHHHRDAAVAALFAFGDGSIFDFALTMLIGVVAGTYSSVFIATPVMMWWYKGRRPQFTSQSAADRKQ